MGYEPHSMLLGYEPHSMWPGNRGSGTVSAAYLSEPHDFLYKFKCTRDCSSFDMMLIYLKL